MVDIHSKILYLESVESRRKGPLWGEGKTEEYRYTGDMKEKGEVCGGKFQWGEQWGGREEEEARRGLTNPKDVWKSHMETYCV